jgi:hypothetical protein
MCSLLLSILAESNLIIDGHVPYGQRLETEGGLMCAPKSVLNRLAWLGEASEDLVSAKSFDTSGEDYDIRCDQQSDQHID